MREPTWDADLARMADEALRRERGEGGPIGLDLADSLEAGDGTVHWHVEGAIVRGAFVQLLGKWESFKSMALLDLGGCAAAGAAWLGMAVERRPFLYVSNEKSPQTIRDRLARIVSPRVLRERVVIVHREGVKFDRHWDRVVARVEELGEPFVAIDTLTSLAPAGFNENKGEHMSVVLDAVRQLTTLGATVAVAHHPSKATNGTGRGHGSLDGEIDGTLEFDRPDLNRPAVNLAIRPKDGEHRHLRLVFDPETLRLEPDVIGPAATVAEVVAAVRRIYRETGQPVRREQVRPEFANHGETVIKARLREAVEGGMLTVAGKGPTTAYLPGDDRDPVD